jgi:hypothetical protein
MRHRIVATVVIPMGVLLWAGAVLAQTAGPSVGPPSPSIIPVTGPSTAPGPLEPAKPELVSMPGTTGQVESGTKGMTRATASGRGSREVKAARKPGSRTVVKKGSAPKRSTVAAGPGKTTRVAKAKTKPGMPAAQTVAGKRLHPIKRPPPAPSDKGTAPAPAVLPRV